eukprot:scaffold15344_cov321-Skeletonema_marinoi.AAC.1
MAAGETKEIGSDNSRHLTHHDGVPTYSTQFRRVSFASCDHPLRKEVDKISNPPSTEAQNDAPGYAADVCHYGDEDVETRSLNASDMLYDSPLATGKTKKEEEEVEPPTSTTSGDVLESRVRGCKPRRSTCPEMSTFEHGELDSILHDSSYHDGCAPTAPREDDGSLLTETKEVREAVGDILPASDRTRRLRYSIRQPSRLTDHLAQSWHPTSRNASLDTDTDLSDQPKHSEREEINERQNLKKQSRSILLRQLRPSRQSFRLGNALDS